MQKIGFAGVLNFAGLFLAILIMIATITQASNLQIIFIQPLYWALDHSWMPGRAIVNFLVAIAAFSITLVRWYFLPVYSGSRNASSGFPKKAIPVILFILMGMLLSLGIYYFSRCCDTPVILALGFPLSWLHIAVEGPAFEYILAGRWFLNGWGVIVDALFWFNIVIVIRFFNHQSVFDNFLHE
jgi:hypothetical protein